MSFDTLRMHHRSLLANVLGRLMLEGGSDLTRPPVLGQHLKESIPWLTYGLVERPAGPLLILCKHGAPPCEPCQAGPPQEGGYELRIPIAGPEGWTLRAGGTEQFGPKERVILEEVGTVIGYAASLRSILNRQFGELTADFDALLEATREISRCEDLEDLYGVVAAMGHTLLNLKSDHFLCLERFNTMEEEVQIVAASGQDANRYQGLILALSADRAARRFYPRYDDGRLAKQMPRQEGPPLTASLMEEGKGFVLVHDVEQRDPGEGYYRLNPTTRSEIAVPITLGDGRPWGVLNLESPRLQNFSSGFDLPVLLGFAKLISIFIQALGHRSRRLNLDGIAGLPSPLKRVIHLSAQSAEPVLITGETGTGKEVVARTLHNDGPRRKRPFIPVNCGALEASLLMNELFGHSANAYTGAGTRDKGGLFHAADGGTIFLDEIENMSMAVQEAVLRVVERGEVRKVGGTDIEEVNVRILAATNVDLRTLIQGGSFRKDLYYRLKILEITLPPLRERVDAIPRLVEEFIGELRRPMQQVRMDPEVMDLFLRYEWPGNVRELKNAVKRMLVFSNNLTVDLLPEDIRIAMDGQTASSSALQSKENAPLPGRSSPLPEEVLPHDDGVPGRFSLEVTSQSRGLWEAAERGLILEALRVAEGDRYLAAHILGISPPTIYRKIKRYRLKEIRRFEES